MKNLQKWVVGVITILIVFFIILGVSILIKNKSEKSDIISKTGSNSEVKNTTEKSNVVSKPVPPNVYYDKELGVSFVIPKGWVMGKGYYGGLESSLVLDEPSTGDKIDIYQIYASKYTDSDSKLGSLTYFFDKNIGSWMLKEHWSDLEGKTIPTAKAVPVLFNKDLPIFIGVKRWKTYIVPVSSSSIITFNITGSGNTEALDELISTINKL
jgi:hypothetical protein